MANQTTTGILNPGYSSSPPPGKSVLKEAVDAVVHSFAKHAQGFGGGKGTCLTAPIIKLIPLKLD